MPAAINDHPAQDVATALPTTTCDPGASPVPESLTSFDIGDPPLSGTSADNGTDSAGSAPGQNPGCVPENTDSGSTRNRDSDKPDRTPRSWTWGYRKLKELVVEAKGAATEEVVNFVMRHLRGTKLIFVVGNAGTGKTTILSELTDLPGLVPGETMQQGTREYHVCPAIIDDEQYLFIDTAGFGDPNCDDTRNFMNVVSCLTAIGAFVQVVGVLFIVGSASTRHSQQDAKMVRWLQCFCGPEFLRNVTVVTSSWDAHSRSSFKQACGRMDSLFKDNTFNQLLHPSHPVQHYHGAAIYHHGVIGGKLTPNSYPGLDVHEHRKRRSRELCNLIRRRYSGLKFRPVKLQFMKEVEDGIGALETEAAKVLRAPPVGLDVGIRAGKCFVRPGPASADAAALVHVPAAPEVSARSWTETLFAWYELVQMLAKYYRARRQPTSSFAQEAWNDIRAWWSKPSNKS